MKKVLVMCHGNINRSPLCHAILAKYEGLEVQSAGFVNPNRRAAKKMRDAALEIDINLEDHRSQLISTELLTWADVVVIMDGGNSKRLQAFIEENTAGIVHSVRLGHYANVLVERVPDPAFIKRGTQEFHDVFSLILEASHNLAKKLIAE